MTEKIIISTNRDETCMALLEKGKLVEYVVERNSNQNLVGNLYKGRVSNVVKGIQSAFIDIGLELNAFLYLGKETDLTEGQSVLVQITKDSRGVKGPTAVRDFTIPGRYAVFLPYTDSIRFSKRITNKEEKKRLDNIVSKNKPEGSGFVLRTIAEGVSEEILTEDIKQLANTWKIIQARKKVGKAPQLLYRELDLSVRVVREYLNQNIESITIDNKVVCERIKELLGSESKELVNKVKFYDGKEDIFTYFNCNDQIDGISDRKVELPSGGYLVIDYTEAMTVIDVNTGAYSGSSNLEETVTLTNKEAAIEIASQLRLRDIGGIVVVDFIDMHTEEHKKEILNTLHEVMQKDKMKPKVQDITVLNLIEITRKKARQNLNTVLYNTCPVCQGSGRIQSPETISIEIKNRLRSVFSKRNAAKSILLEVHPFVSGWFINKELKNIERELSCDIRVVENASLQEENFSILDNSNS